MRLRTLLQLSENQKVIQKKPQPTIHKTKKSTTHTTAVLPALK